MAVIGDDVKEPERWRGPIGGAIEKVEGKGGGGRRWSI